MSFEYRMGPVQRVGEVKFTVWKTDLETDVFKSSIRDFQSVFIIHNNKKFQNRTGLYTHRVDLMSIDDVDLVLKQIIAILDDINFGDLKDQCECSLKVVIRTGLTSFSYLVEPETVERLAGYGLGIRFEFLCF